MSNKLAFSSEQSALKPKFIKPEILLHPNIPKPLHGLNPRTLLGKEWWDKQRQIAYKENNYCCWACGVSKWDAKYHQWLEGHECYKFDYTKGTAEMIYISALCHSCHNFIHSGRMQMILGTEEMPFDKYEDILAHGDNLVGKALRSALVNNPFIVDIGANKTALWNEWRLIIDGTSYYSKFKNFDEWKAFYSG